MTIDINIETAVVLFYGLITIVATVIFFYCLTDEKTMATLTLKAKIRLFIFGVFMFGMACASILDASDLIPCKLCCPTCEQYISQKNYLIRLNYGNDNLLNINVRAGSVKPEHKDKFKVMGTTQKQEK
jgi:hypothetical protein